MSFDIKRMMKFEHNVGDKEKKYRLYAGVALIAVSVFTAQILLLVVGLILTATGFSGWCPVYSGMNKNTCCATAGEESGASAEGTTDESSANQ